MRRLTVLLTAFAILLTILAPAALAAPGQSFPKILPLPDGFRPEGVAVGRGTTFYVGSLAGGAVYRGDLRTGEGAVFVQPQAGRAIAGIYADQRSNALFASGTQSGNAYVFDAQTGAELASYQLTTASAKFINDVIVTGDAAYFTNSFAAEIYRVPLGPGGSLPNQSAVQTIPLTGAWVQVPGPFVFNANGIEATADGRWLFIVNSTRGELYRVDPQTGSANSGQPGRRQSEQWRRPQAARKDPVRRSQSVEPDSGGQVGARLCLRHARAHHHRSGLRSADHRGPVWLPAVCSQRPLWPAAWIV